MSLLCFLYSFCLRLLLVLSLLSEIEGREIAGLKSTLSSFDLLDESSDFRLMMMGDEFK